MSALRARLLLAAAAAAAYAGALGGGFQFDDWNVVVGDPRVQDLAAWWAGMPGMRPLLKLSYAANHALGGGAAAFHALNVAVHAVAAMLAFDVLRGLAAALGAVDTAQAAGAGGAPSRRATTAAFAGALVFALHPVQSEAVAYVSGRSSSLSGALALLAAALWLAGRRGGRPRLVHLGAPAAYAAAIGVKETAWVLPLALAPLLWLGPRPPDGRRARDLAGLGVVAALAAALALASPVYRDLLETSLAARGPGEQVRAAVAGLVYLTSRLVRIDRLNADPDVAIPAAGDAAFLLGVAALAGALAFALSPAGRRRPALAFAILWYLAWLAPVCGPVPRLDPASERNLYVALLGPALAAGWWVAGRVAGRVAPAGARAAAIAGCVAVAVLLGATTARRTLVYRDEVVFWTDVVAKSPRKARAWNNLGVAFLEADRTAEADAAFSRALELDPLDYRAAFNREALRSRPRP